LTHQSPQMRNPHGLAGVTDKQLAARPYRALVYTQDAELSNIGIDRDLEHVRNHMPVGFRLDLHALHSVPERSLEEGRRIALGRVRHQTLDNVEQLGNTGAGLGGDETDRDEMALAQGLLKRVVELLRGEILSLFQIERHQLLIELDDLVDDLGV